MKPTTKWLLLGLSYVLLSNFAYLARRARVRKSGGMTIKKLFNIRLEREKNVSWMWYGVFVLAWQIFALTIFPWLEPLVYLGFRHVSFYYSYPNANGFGLILEPLDAQDLPMRKRQKTQKRLDWHKFTINVGPMDKYGFRHPPKKELHLPHLDVPQLGMKHWPWDRNSIRQGKLKNRPLQVDAALPHLRKKKKPKVQPTSATLSTEDKEKNSPEKCVVNEGETS
jgi:hypothetical protein